VPICFVFPCGRCVHYGGSPAYHGLNTRTWVTRAPYVSSQKAVRGPPDFLLLEGVLGPLKDSVPFHSIIFCFSFFFFATGHPLSLFPLARQASCGGTGISWCIRLPAAWSTYLSSQEFAILHRDLAARNCLAGPVQRPGPGEPRSPVRSDSPASSSISGLFCFTLGSHSCVARLTFVVVSFFHFGRFLAWAA
jgi:hypothetical protein